MWNGGDTSMARKEPRTGAQRKNSFMTQTTDLGCEPQVGDSFPLLPCSSDVGESYAQMPRWSRVFRSAKCAGGALGYHVWQPQPQADADALRGSNSSNIGMGVLVPLVTQSRKGQALTLRLCVAYKAGRAGHHQSAN